jgi:prevent-host-death family protein
MQIWSEQQAKRSFGELLETCLRDGPQIITRRGENAAILVPALQWQPVAKSDKPTLKELLLTDVARFDMQIPTRRRRRRVSASS